MYSSITGYWWDGLKSIGFTSVSTKTLRGLLLLAATFAVGLHYAGHNLTLLKWWEGELFLKQFLPRQWFGVKIIFISKLKSHFRFFCTLTYINWRTVSSLLQSTVRSIFPPTSVLRTVLSIVCIGCIVQNTSNDCFLVDVVLEKMGVLHCEIFIGCTSAKPLMDIVENARARK